VASFLMYRVGHAIFFVIKKRIFFCDL